LILHATTVALRTSDGWRGALLSGASGAGKSDLALRLLAAGGRLAADDRTLVWSSGGALWGRAPDSIAGRIEARGLGIVSAPALGLVRIVLFVALDGPAAERLPDPGFETLAGIALPRLRLEPYEASGPVKLALALQGRVEGLGDEG
jgi:hypothetical protein